MADKVSSASSKDDGEVEFMTPPASDGEQSVELDMDKLFYGDALEELDEDAQEGLKKIEVSQMQMSIMKHDDEDKNKKRAQAKTAAQIQEERKARHVDLTKQNPEAPEGDVAEDRLADFEESSEPESQYSLSENVQTNLGVLYTVQGQEANEPDMKVLKFTDLFLPDSEKRRKQMDMYNRKKMLDLPDFEDEAARKRKRDLKDSLKRSTHAYKHKAKYLPVVPFMEDFHYLQGYSKNGVPPQSSKKPQVPSGYKPFYAQGKVDHHTHMVDRVISKANNKKSILKAHTAHVGNDQPKREAEVSKAPQQRDSLLKKDFALESCQINEIKSRIVRQNLPHESQTMTEADKLASLRQKLRKAKQIVRKNLERKVPAMKSLKVERQSFALLNQLKLIYGQETQTQVKPRVQPTEVDVYEAQIQERFRNQGVPEKRVKLWGELKDQVSDFQRNKDFHAIKKQQWSSYLQDRQSVKQPIFALITPVEGSTDGQPQPNNGPAALSQQQKDQLQRGPAGAPRPGEPLAPQGGLGAIQKPQMPAETNRPVKRPPPVIVEKSDFDLVTNYEEYEKLKEQEALYYRQRKKCSVTAESIMRHVRWKMGRISDKDFYREEFLEMRREEQIEERAKLSTRDFRNSLHDERAKARGGLGSWRGSNIATPATELTESEPKDLESCKKQRTVPVEFEENLDFHFDRKRIEIQERILRLKSEKERASQQKQNTTQTPAYEPMPVEQKESEDNHGSDRQSNRSDNDSSSSDSDSESEDAVPQSKQAGGHTLMPSIADELNHAQCIKDLSYFKLNWAGEDLKTFHRPNIQSYFLESGKITAQAVSTKKEDKETRLDPHLYFKNRHKLSLNKGKFCIFEHIDQHPLFVNNFGMASHLKRYYYGDKQPSKKEFLNQKSENIANRHIGPYGKFMLKQPLEKLDLLGQVDTTKYKGLTILENKMYNAPVFYHRMPSTNNDFFCSMIKQPNSKRRIVIRPLSSFYTVGQLEPKLEVYNPQSRHFTHFIKQQSKAYTTRLLQENKIMSFHDIRRFFPQIGSPILKKGLKEIEVEQDRNGYCRLNDNFEMERHKDRMTPEMICQYESAKHGQFRLESIGISEILSADKISYSTHKYCFEETDLILQRVAKLVESEILQTPWNLSSNYIKIKQEGSMMMLKGQGDPSYGHGGYSYLKMPLKISADSIQGARENRMNLNPAIQNPKAVTGTDADLRKLKKLQLYEILRKAGVSEKELARKSRWEMVAMLRSYASQQAPGVHAMKSCYARGVRHTSKRQQEMYIKRANSTFRKQMDTLADPNPRDLHDFQEKMPNFTSLPDLKAMGLELIGRGFGTSLTRQPKSKNQAERRQIMETLREPGENAKDFTRDIFDLVTDETRKKIIEVDVLPDIKSIDDIKDYLKLYLVIHPNALSSQNQNPSGINIGGVSANTEFLSAMNGSGSKEWENKLLEKLQNREISKKIEILCHKIRSIAQDYDNESSQKNYERIIFCADEKDIKKFKRCMNKNQMRTPRRINRRNMGRQTRPLTDENLKLQAAKNYPQGSSGKPRSTSRSITSTSIHKGGTSIALRTSIDKPTYPQSQRSLDRENLSQSQFSRDVTKVKLRTGGRDMASASKSKKKQRKAQTLRLKQNQPALRFNITNNGVVVQPLALQDNTMPPIPNTQPSEMGKGDNRPVMIVALSGPTADQLPLTQQQTFALDSGLTSIQDEANCDQNQILSLSQPVTHTLQTIENQVMDAHQSEDEKSPQKVTDEVQEGDESLSNNLVNNQEVSFVASEYEPEGQVNVEEDSDYDMELSDISPLPRGSKGLKKKPLDQRYQRPLQQIGMQKQRSMKGTNRNRKNQSSLSKFKPHGFSNDDFEYQNLTLNKSRRRQQQDGTQSLNSIFMDIVDKLQVQDGAYLFHNQPTRQEAPNYRDLIGQPIAFKDMKNKAKRNEYKDRRAFEADMELMVDNAVLYNGSQHSIAQLARRLQAIAQADINSKRGDIETMECVIKMDGAGQI